MHLTQNEQEDQTNNTNVHKDAQKNDTIETGNNHNIKKGKKTKKTMTIKAQKI